MLGGGEGGRSTLEVETISWWKRMMLLLAKQTLDLKGEFR